MARVRRIVVSQIQGDYSNNSDKRPNGEIALYDDGDNGFDLVIHDGVNSTNENKVLGKGKLYGHNGSARIIAGPTSSVQWSFNLDGDLVLPEGGDIKDYFGSSVLSSAVLDVTYSELVSLIDEGNLTAGKFYKITDFKTCYDQPNYNINRNAIYRGNYKEGSNHPIVVFAISSDKLSVDAWQPDFPKDRIKYEVGYSTTYTTGGTAFGRIIERIDEWNNRTDYDHRDILFRRYRHYYTDLVPLSGRIDMFESGELIGVDSQFDVDFSVNDYLFLSDNLELVYKITEISSSQSMSVTGSYIPNVNGSNYHKGYRTSEGNLDGYLQCYQNNVDGPDDYLEFHTFKLENETIVNNKFGDFYSLTWWNEPYFDLPNNVFGEDVISSIFGSSFENNTFVDDVEETRIGDYCRNNIYYSDQNDFDDNVIGNFFQNNTILNRFDRNSIKNYFENNYIKGNCENNFIGDNFTDNRINNNYGDNNVGNNFQNNKIYENFDDNKIGNGFNNNTIEDNFYDNTINVFFEYNHTYSSFNKNTIGNSCAQNVIYSDFYENNIGLYFGSNVIGDKGNLSEFNFYRNRIGNNFGDNNIKQDFQNNQIGNQFEYNNVYGDFYKNVIGNGFNGNGYIGHGFYGNHIGNGFNDNNYIGDYFNGNKIGEYFENNYITNNFRENSIGNIFVNNTLGDTQYFTWDNTTIENLNDRNYSTFYNSLYGDNGENIGNVILGKELIMHFSRSSGTTQTAHNLVIGETYEITNYLGDDDFTDVADVISGVINTNGCIFVATGATVSNWSSGSELTELTSYDEYHLVKFTQWTQNNNGGGFTYERTKVYPTSEPTVYFTKLNYGSEVDVIIPSRLEIRRGDNGAIYNYVEENRWNQNVSPQGTEWNSIYTQNQDGFTNNEIQNEFKGNLILSEFSVNKIGYGFSSNILYSYFVSNITDGVFYSNDVNYFYSNRVGEYFWENTIGDNFNNNEVDIWFSYNNIAPDFSNNKIGKYFQDNTIEEGFGSGYGDTQTNIIGDYFRNNNIGEYFYNNKVVSYFQDNNVGYYFQRNNIDTPISEEDFIGNYGNILSFTYQSSGTTSTPGFYMLNGTTNGHGQRSSFGITVSGGTVSTISLMSAGNQYAVGNTISITGTQIGGVSRAISTFSIKNLSVKIYKPADATYQYPSDETEMDYLIDNSPLFDTYYSSNIEGVSYTTEMGTVDENEYAMVIEGYIQIPSDNTYYFGLNSDDGSDAFINGVKVADWYGAHGNFGPTGSFYPISLTKGKYPIKVRLQERTGGDIVSLQYSLDGVSWNIIPDNWFTPDITGIRGSYPGIFATGGTGEGSTFDVEVIGGLVDSVVLNNGGGSYSVGNVLTIPGSEFGGTQSIIINVDSIYSDDVTITVTEVSATPSVYETYNCQIFERRGGDKRLSFYDENDVLTIKNINE